MVVVDKFSRFAHFIPLRHPISAASMARAFLDHIYKLHGLPLAIISNRDRLFTSKFWQLLFKLAGTTGLPGSRLKSFVASFPGQRRGDTSALKEGGLSAAPLMLQQMMPLEV